MLDLLADARSARESGDWKLAQSLANAVIALDPTNVEAKNLVRGPAVRRQMTLLFCDIVGSTQLADDRDPEEMTALLGAYRTICSEIVDRHGGFVEDHRGDGMLVLFGYPQVNEDDARRAVSCGREIVGTLDRRMRSILNRPEEVTVQVRIAVHTDLVVLDGVGVAGATANEAARIQDHASPNTVVISDATKALVWPYFETTSIGIVPLRGVSRPIEIFTVLRERSTPHRAVAASPFVGRRAELEELARFLRGQAPVLFVSGQAGVGKTRLVTEALNRLRVPVLMCRASRVEQNTSLHVFRRLIEQACEIDESDGPESRLAKLRARVGDAMIQHGDLPFLSGALGIPLNILRAPVAVNPSQLREYALHTAAGLIRQFGGQPTVLFIDDVHWGDQSSVDLISVLLTASSGSVRLVLTAREGFEPPWPASVVERLNLEPLDRGSLLELAGLLPEGSRLTGEDLDELIDRSDGIPLFLEELLRTADALGRGEIVHRSIRFGEYRVPPALLDPLLARLASPRVDLELTQIAATIGREVDRALLQRVMDINDDEFRNRVDTLLAAGLIEQSNRGLRFRHELIREVAYESQRRSTRRRNHSTLADVIGDAGTELAPAMISEQANHLERAGRHAEAIAAHLRVAEADQSVGAHSEVITRLTHTLSLIDLLEDDPQRLHTELVVRKIRSFSAVTSQGFGAPEAGADYERTAELGRILVDAPETVPALMNSWTYYLFRGALDQADALIESAVRQCAAARIPAVAVDACYGLDEFFRGHFEQSSSIFDAFIDAEGATASDRPPLAVQLPSDPLGGFAAHQAFTRWAQGDRAASKEYLSMARRRVDQLSFPFAPFTSCYIDHFESAIQVLEGDYQGVMRTGSHMLELAERHGFAMWQLTAALHLGLGAVMLGQHDALTKFAEHTTITRDVLGALVHMPFWLTQLATAQRAAGRTEDALRSLNAALESADQTGSMFYSAETLRLLGQLRLETGDRAGIADLREAIELADRQGIAALAARARKTMRELVNR